METRLSPAARTVITGEGTVVRHDETRYGLRRLCVMSRAKYPDADLWAGLLPENAEVKSAMYTEQDTNGVWAFYLLLYWKERK